jgi:hypothetical protein
MTRYARLIATPGANMIRSLSNLRANYVKIAMSFCAVTGLIW